MQNGAQSCLPFTVSQHTGRVYLALANSVQAALEFVNVDQAIKTCLLSLTPRAFLHCVPRPHSGDVLRSEINI